MARETLTFDDLGPHLLLKNGNFLYKVPYRDGWAVLKVYYGSRSMWETLTKSIGMVAFEGQTSYLPRTRLRIERECLNLWRDKGFRVFGLYEDVDVRAPGCPDGGYLLMEYVEATKLMDHLNDQGIPLDDRMATWRRFLQVWARRHEVAVAEREPRLIHENGDPRHVMLVGDEFLWFDFEMVYRSRSRVEEFVGHEIVQYIWELLRNTPADMHERLLQETVEGYPHPRFVRMGYDVFFNHPRPFQRLGRYIDRKRARAAKPTSKYNVARKLVALQ